MNHNVVRRILGLILMIYSLTLLPPIAVSLFYADGHSLAFLNSLFVVLSAGFVLWWPARSETRDMRLREGFMVVSLFWVMLSIAGASPLLITDRPDLSFTDAVFESVSGFTTTGATIITGLDGLPRSVLWYRQQIQWLGGGGIIVLAIALLPVLGVGGMQLYKAEAPGAVKDQKLAPRITQTAKLLWLVYSALTVACAFAYWGVGMSPFDAMAHAFSTLSTGGFSTYDASLGHFHSPNIEWVAILFMFLGGVNFTLHFVAFRNLSPRHYWTDPEFRGYLAVLTLMVAFITVYLWTAGVYTAPGATFRHAAFAWVSMQTSTGFLSEHFSLWPGPLPPLLLLATFIGGCAGSSAGGMKVIRWQLVAREGQAEMRRLVHPRAEVLIKYAGRLVSPRVLSAVGGFFAIYLLLFGVLMLLLMMTGLDQVSAWSAVATTLNNSGPGLGSVSMNFQALSDAGKWISVVAMLLGRLEVFTLLVIFTPAFWRS